ncbi:MAG: cyclic nucleotide-binding domain-containing protein [Verrucomicrobia bacterium]|nr:MAG: cyclic nucleotide-binding domain-containing protein [Verrucomicrobiota bacterium]
MSAKASDNGFFVWDPNHTAHGPVELPILVSWVKAGRVKAGTWVFVKQSAVWERAADVPELQLFFHTHFQELAAQSEPLHTIHGINPRALRAIRLLAYFTDEQLERFANFVEAVRLPQAAVVVKQGDQGNAMYLVVEGELSVRMKVDGLESELATLTMGDFFGDFSLFDHGPRSADVVVNKHCLLLRISTDAFDRLTREATDLATPFLRAIGKTLTARIRAGNKHQAEAVKMANALK